MHTAESNFSNFVIEYLGKIETEFKNILACLSRAQMGSNHGINRGRKSRDTLPLCMDLAYIGSVQEGALPQCPLQSRAGALLPGGGGGQLQVRKIPRHITVIFTHSTTHPFVYLIYLPGSDVVASYPCGTLIAHICRAQVYHKPC